jgi:hypothetical protein
MEIRNSRVQPQEPLRPFDLPNAQFTLVSSWRGWGKLEWLPAALSDPARYAGYRFPTAVIQHALWLVNRFSLR